MRLIATHVDDTFSLLRSKLEQEKAKPHRAIDPILPIPSCSRARTRALNFQELDLRASRERDPTIWRLPTPRDWRGQHHYRARRGRNICNAQHFRHRGARVCEAKSGNRKTFVCPYHGWVITWMAALRRLEKRI